MMKYPHHNIYNLKSFNGRSELDSGQSKCQASRGNNDLEPYWRIGTQGGQIQWRWLQLNSQITDWDSDISKFWLCGVTYGV